MSPTSMMLVQQSNIVRTSLISSIWKRSKSYPNTNGNEMASKQDPILNSISVVTSGNNPIRIIFFAIMRNESKIIRRCLDSVRSVVDAICISNTGSPDDTMVELIHQAGHDYKIPAKVPTHEWKNFEHNRSLSMVECQQFAKEQGWSLDRTYGLTIDGDMELKVEKDFDKQKLTKDEYLLEQHNGDLRYFNPRLFKLSLPWKCIGVTHEYWGLPKEVPHVQENLHTLWIDDRDDGGAKSDKFERDIRLLTQGLIDEPDNYRYRFYLAQSYHSIRRYDESIHHYKLRIPMGGFEEEVWYSHLIIADCYKKKSEQERHRKEKAKKELETIPDDYGTLRKDVHRSAVGTMNIRQSSDGPMGEDETPSEEASEDPLMMTGPSNDLQAIITEASEKEETYWALALSWYLKAYQRRPWRFESLCDVAKRYREVGDQELGFLFADICSQASFPDKDSLFITDSVYSYDPIREMAICGYYTHEHKMDGFNACEEILFNLDIPSWVKDATAMNEYYYILKLSKLSVDWVREIDIERPFIDEDGPVNPALTDGSPDSDSEDAEDSGSESDENERKPVKVKEEKKPIKEDTKENSLNTTELDRLRYRGLNPSFVRDGNGYSMIFRTVNFLHNNQKGSYTSMHADGLIRTRNFLVKLDNYLKVKSCIEIVEGPLGKSKMIHPAKVTGMEDCRVFRMATRLWFTCTTCETRKSCVPQITLCRIGKSPNKDGKLEVDLFVPLKGVVDQENEDLKGDHCDPKGEQGDPKGDHCDPKGEHGDPKGDHCDPKGEQYPLSTKTKEDHCEKNWLPFDNAGEINIIYGYTPFTIAKPKPLKGTTLDKNTDTGIVEPILKVETGLDLSRFRGGSSPVAFNHGYIFVIHEVIFQKRDGYYQRHYVHRFVYMNKEYVPQKISLPFYFEKPDTEFCSGLALDFSGKQLMMACGINDEKVCIYGISEEKVIKMLRDIVQE